RPSHTYPLPLPDALPISSHRHSNPEASTDPLFQTERNAFNLSYAVPVPNGTYIVRTYHNELYFGKGGPTATAGKRVFDIRLEGRSEEHTSELQSRENLVC